MPSKNPTIAVRLSPEMYNQVRELAEAQHRSLSNFVEHHLRRLLGPDNETVFREVVAAEAQHNRRRGVQVDLETAIADAVKRGPVKPAKHK